MISDFSGIIFDYTFLRDKPVIYVQQSLDITPYDAWDIDPDPEKSLWLRKALRSFGIELKEELFANIGEVIRSASDSAELKAARAKARDEAWMYRGEAAKRIVDFMLEVEIGQDDAGKVQ
jgi:CDP-glycerol glycerophosphotransferase (TagB/SpsB family)